MAAVCLTPVLAQAQAPARPAAPASSQTAPVRAATPVQPAGSDEIVIRSGAVYRGKVLAATAKSVKIEIAGRGTFDVPREQIDRMKVSPPAAIIRGIQAFEKGSAKEAVATLKTAVFQFQGLDTDWASMGLLAYAGASLMDNNFAEAEKAFRAFMQLYPDHDREREAAIGLAEVDIARNQYDVALSNLLVMAESYDVMLKPDGDKLRQAAQLHRDVARCYEGLNRLDDALAAYTRVIALYPWPAFYADTLYAAAGLASRLGQLQRADLILTELIEDYKEFSGFRDAVKEQTAVRQKIAAESQQ